MAVIKKTFHDSLQFPISFQYQDTKEPKNELPEHFHDRYEIIYVHSGQGTLFLNNTFFSMSPGDLFLIPKDMIHHTLQDHDNPLTSSVLFFDSSVIEQENFDDHFSYRSLFQSVNQHKKYRMALNLHQRALLENLFIHISLEMSQKPIGYKSAVLSWVHFLLLTLYRMMIEKRDTSHPSIDIGPKWMSEALTFIDQHLNEHLSLSELSKRAFISPEHFSRVFKEMVGMNLTHYLNSKRVIKAKDLLVTTNMNVSEIAEEVGFNSPPYFFRMFKKSVGLTPSEYRKASRL